MPYKMIFDFGNYIKELYPLQPDSPKRTLEDTNIKVKGELVAKGINRMNDGVVCKVERYGV